MTSSEKNAPSPVTFWTENYDTGVKTLNDISHMKDEQSGNFQYSGLTVQQYIKYAHLVQYHPMVEKEMYQNKYKLAELVNAVRAYENGSGDPVEICFRNVSENSGHSVMGLRILKDDSYETEIEIYDSNFAYRPSEMYKPHILTLLKENGKYTVWQLDASVWKGEYSSTVSSENWISYKTSATNVLADFINNGLRFKEEDFDGWAILTAKEKEKSTQTILKYFLIRKQKSFRWNLWLLMGQTQREAQKVLPGCSRSMTDTRTMARSTNRRSLFIKKMY